MKRFADNLASFALVIVIILGVGLFVPALREVLWGLAVFFWTIIKAFFLQDIVQKLLIMVVIAVVGSGLCLSRKEKGKLWGFLTGAAELIALVVMFIPKG